MRITKFKLKIGYLINPISIIVIATILRLLPHPPNVAPISAIALFGGVYLNKKLALLIPLCALFLSDLLLGFYKPLLMAFVYGSFLLIGCIGILIRKRKNLSTIVGSSLFCSILFFLITNFGVWLTGSIYAKNLNGLTESYFMAIPFLRNTVIGDLLYVSLFFLAYEIALKLGKETRFLRI